MAEVYKKSVRRGGQQRGGRGKVPTTLRSDLKSDIDPSTYANPAGSKATKRVQTDYPYKKKPESFPGSPKSKVGKQKPKTVDQPIYKRGVKGPKDIDKSMKLSTSKRKTPSPDWGGAFSKWVGGIGDDMARGATLFKGDASALWDKFTKQFEGEAPKSPPASAKSKINKAINVAKKTGESETLPKRVKKKTPYQKMDAPGRKKPYRDKPSPGKAMPPASAKKKKVPTIKAPAEPFKVKPKKETKKVAKKKVSKPTNVNTGDAAYIPSDVKRKEWGGKSQDDLYKETKEAKKKKKAAAPSEAQIDKGGAFGPKDEETADFKNFLKSRGGVKGFQFNLVGKNKTKAEGMKRAREAYAEEQRDRKRPGRSDHYQYGEGRRAVKKKGGAMRKSQGGTIRLKTGGAVIDTYDY
jgi:hypothetical protein